MYTFLKILLYIPFKLLLPTRVYGKSNIDKKGKLIIVCNHQSLFDVLLIMMSVRRKVYFVGKKELFKNKFLAWVFRSMGVIKINREATDVNTIKSILKVLKEECILGIFPEGTRNRTLPEGELQPFKEGVSLFAVKTDSPIVPIYIAKKSKIFRLNKMYIGKSFKLEKDKKENANLPLQTEFIRNKIIELKIQSTNNFRK